MILAAHTTLSGTASVLADLLVAFLPRGPRRLRLRRSRGPAVEDALVRALCHDMRGSVTWLESTLSHLDRDGPPPPELLGLARAQAAHLASMLRTAEASGGVSPRPAPRSLGAVVAASVAASGLPRQQLTVRLRPPAGDVAVGDARVQRILVNLLENAHRHGEGRPVQLGARCREGWVELVLRQPGVRREGVAGYLNAPRPPADLTGLGLWSVQRQARELGGRVLCSDDDAALVLTVQLPDR